MLARLMRLQRNSVAIYRETGSARAACAYAGRMLATKASLLGRHARSLRKTLTPWHAAAEVKRLEALRQDGSLVLAIGISGGIGDLIVAARFMRDLAAQTEAFTFDVFAARPSLIDWIFSKVPGFARARSTRSATDLRFFDGAVTRICGIDASMETPLKSAIPS
jgi:hypothetical protein